MVLNIDVLISGFVLGLVMGVTADLINKFVSAFSHWVKGR